MNVCLPRSELLKQSIAERAMGHFSIRSSLKPTRWFPAWPWGYSVARGRRGSLRLAHLPARPGGDGLAGGLAFSPNLLATLALRSHDPAEVGRFIGSLRLIGPVVLAPAMLAVLGFGIWLVLDSETWSFEQTWVWLALILFGAAFLVGAVFQSRAAIDAQRASDSGQHHLAARQLNRWSLGMRLILLLLVVAAWDMVFKPGF